MPPLLTGGCAAAAAASAAAAAGPSVATNAEDIDLDDAEDAKEDAEPAAAPAEDDIQLQAKPVPVRPACQPCH